MKRLFFRGPGDKEKQRASKSPQCKKSKKRKKARSAHHVVEVDKLLEREVVLADGLGLD
jgi:hypothetical protein